MRTFLIAAIAAAAIATPASAATRNFGVNSFDKIRVEGPYKIKLTTGVPVFARASGSSSALDRVSIESQGSTLIVHPNRSSWGGYPGRDSGTIEIEIGTHELVSAWLNGSGVLGINKVKGLSFDLSVQGSGSTSIAQVDVDQLNITVAGTANATLAGRAAKTTAIIRGISSLDATGLSSKDATIGADGAATIRADVTNSAKIDASGPATIAFTGKPACTLRASGSTSVSGCKSTQ
jgi:Putative auto-transporter adhesin, head GIN domain